MGGSGHAGNASTNQHAVTIRKQSLAHGVCETLPKLRTVVSVGNVKKSRKRPETEKGMTQQRVYGTAEENTQGMVEINGRNQYPVGPTCQHLPPPPHTYHHHHHHQCPVGPTCQHLPPPPPPPPVVKIKPKPKPRIPGARRADAARVLELLCAGGRWRGRWRWLAEDRLVDGTHDWFVVAWEVDASRALEVAAGVGAVGGAGGRRALAHNGAVGVGNRDAQAGHHTDGSLQAGDLF